MTDVGSTITASARAVESLAPAILGLELDDAEHMAFEQAVARGHFTPAEDDALRAWFARYLTARAGLLEVIDDLQPFARGSGRIDEATTLRAFVVAFCAASLLVRAARYLVREVAADGLVQRKLNEGAPRFRIPRKQYTAIYDAVTSPHHAWLLNGALEFAETHQAEIEAFRDDPELGRIVEHLATCEDALRLGIRDYLKARAKYRLHSARRHRASAVEQAVFGILEAFGRVIAEMRLPWHESRLDGNVLAALSDLLAPGDVLITRHDNALSNLFLPGYWPHAALHLGTPEAGRALGIELDDARAARWCEPRRVLEARKDGVLFRPLDDTLAVDAVVVLRPSLDAPDIGRALTRAIAHEGKLYNFDFDFFTADRLVCTEVVYRAFDGVGDLAFELSRRSGRLTLSAEDLVAMALERRGFEPVAVFGTPQAAKELVTGARCQEILARLRDESA